MRGSFCLCDGQKLLSLVGRTEEKKEVEKEGWNIGFESRFALFPKKSITTFKKHKISQQWAV